MQTYLVTLEFEVAFALCGPDDGTPEQVASDVKEMILRCVKEMPDEDKMRVYHCELPMQTDSPNTVGDSVASMFNHLPRFRLISKTVDPLKHPTATTATKEYVVVCRFRSAEAFFRLSHAFDKHISEGVLFPAPNKPGRYVAYVVMRSPTCDGVEEMVERLLTEAFEADSAETAERFTDETITLL